MSDESYMGQMFNRFHLHESIEERVAMADGTMVLKKHRFILLKQGHHTDRYLGGSCSRIRGQRNRANCHDCFLAENLIYAFSRTCEGRRDGRVTMHDSIDILAFLINGEMHVYLTRDSFRAGKRPSFEID
jgi:hypothetical protein